MKGHDIAEELRNTKLPWARYRLSRDGAYCVLGIKALEHGATPEQVEKANSIWIKRRDSDLLFLTRSIWEINDNSISREEAAAKFDDEVNRDKDFPVEEFVEWVKSL